MPQLTKGGKFIFGYSLIRSDGAILLPAQAVDEYAIASEGRVFLISGSKTTGGFCVTRRALLEKSRLAHILTENPALRDFSLLEGEFIGYKGRFYCWIKIGGNGVLRPDGKTLSFLRLTPGMRLISIRSSDIAFTMGAEGPLFAKAESFPGTIPIFR